jgi:hypothetical protein
MLGATADAAELLLQALLGSTSTTMSLIGVATAAAVASAAAAEEGPRVATGTG